MQINYEREVREALQDYPELNHILLERNNGEEHSEREIKRYIKRALARINMLPPVTQFPLERFPDTHWLLLVDGAVVEALYTKGLLKIRNDMNYQDQGGTTVNLDGKGQQYFSIAQNLYNRWMRELENFKKGISVDQAWGGVNSDFQRNYW